MASHAAAEREDADRVEHSERRRERARGTRRWLEIFEVGADSLGKYDRAARPESTYTATNTKAAVPLQSSPSRPFEPQAANPSGQAQEPRKDRQSEKQQIHGNQEELYVEPLPRPRPQSPSTATQNIGFVSPYDLIQADKATTVTQQGGITGTPFDHRFTGTHQCEGQREWGQQCHRPPLDRSAPGPNQMTEEDRRTRPASSRAACGPPHSSAERSGPARRTAVEDRVPDTCG